MTITPWLRRYPLTGYFALAFGISWGGILVVLTAAKFDLLRMQPKEAGFPFPSTSPSQGLFWQSLFALALWAAVSAAWQWSAALTGRSQLPQTNVDNDRQRLRRP